MLRLPSPSVTRTHLAGVLAGDQWRGVETPIPVGDEDARPDSHLSAHNSVETPIPVGDEDAPGHGRDLPVDLQVVETPIPVGDEDALRIGAALTYFVGLRLPSPSVTRTH